MLSIGMGARGPLPPFRCSSDLFSEKVLADLAGTEEVLTTRWRRRTQDRGEPLGAQTRRNCKYRTVADNGQEFAVSGE